MNRIILMGNGFDLAHGMKTSYKNFLDDYWRKTIEEAYKRTVYKFENEDIKVVCSSTLINPSYKYDDFKIDIERDGESIIFKNKFLEVITEKNLENWVDIENEYYSLLVDSYREPTNKYNVIELNKDFKRITTLLEDYLTNIEKNTKLNNPRIKDRIATKIYSHFNSLDFTEKFLVKKSNLEYENFTNKKKEIFSGLITEEKQKIYEEFLASKKRINDKDWLPDNILFLNFNYTLTDELYSPFDIQKKYTDKQINTESIHIHGSLHKSDNNPIIFGFGDEIDEYYKEIENLNDNRYLDNIKSIKYLETNNYKRLLQFINSDEYQILIFGHSCGVSDRTLLNTLFEHKNCVSIKPFYYEKDDTTDNYTEIIQNASRHFNDKTVMREKIVNKTYCSAIDSK